MVTSVRVVDLSIIACLAVVVSTSVNAADELPSWNDGHAKSAIIQFVERVTRMDSPDFVPIQERVATFDNDGTLWSEQPVYFQALFAIDRVRDLSANHPEWRDTEPLKSAIEGDMKGVMATGMEGLEQIFVASHANITAEEFERSVRGWLATARHPTTGKPYTEMVYQPMLELLAYLRAHDFKTFIVSGGGIDFMRVFAEPVYGIPPEQVIGSTIDATFEMRDGVPTIVKTGKLVLLDDKAWKPVGIYRHIGRRPVLAAGNSDGDLQMLEYTTIHRNDEDKSPRFAMIVHHTDADREWAYDRESHIGRLNQALAEAETRGWMVVDMKRDWKRVFKQER